MNELDNLKKSIGELSQKGLFITCEGVDGAGKSTHFHNLVDIFEAAGREVVLTREPGGTPLAENLRKIILNDPMDPMTEALLAFAGRRDHIKNVITPALDRGAIVLCDRFTDSTYAYQSAGRGFDAKIVNTLENMVQEGLHPDLTLWFDLPSEVAAARRGAVRAPDKFESEDVIFFNKVRGGYLSMFYAEPERFVRINAEQTQEKVWNDTCEKLGEKLDDFSRHNRNHSVMKP